MPVTPPHPPSPDGLGPSLSRKRARGGLGDDEFAALMAPLGPFEDGPRLAVAVSGGADSMALCVLADHWARAQGGLVAGLTVDHGLRREAGAEAAAVGDWLRARGIAHHVLTWSGAKPATGIQAAARGARYDLLRGWCREAGVLHLLLAHHLDDQAETLLLRLGRGSGVDGLSAMAPLSFTTETRLLRPLLGVSHARLVATLEDMGQSWIEDPSNRSPAYGRVRWRRLMPQLAAEGLDAERLAATAGRLGRARQALERATAELLVQSVALHAAGFARLDVGRLAEAPDEIALRALAGVCRTVGGAVYPPRLERLERLYGELRAGPPRRRTFAGCVLARTRDGVVVCREPAAVAGSHQLRAGETALWDHRYTVRLGGRGEGRVDALGKDGWLAIRDEVVSGALPAMVVETLPTIIDRHGIFAVPHLGYKRQTPSDLTVDHVTFTPACPLAGAGHCLV